MRFLHTRAHACNPQAHACERFMARSTRPFRVLCAFQFGSLRYNCVVIICVGAGRSSAVAEGISEQHQSRASDVY